MLLWFAGFAVVAVWFVFRDPQFDLRILVLGALLPDLIDGLTGRAGVFHSLTAAVVVLVGVMLATIGRRPARRRWLALPIGMFLHLIADGAFATTELFWWPFMGWSLGDHPLPSVARGWWNLPLEVLGASALVWAWRRFGLADPERRRTLVREGTVHVVH
jgi:chromate transport protein ChrA